jgi:hypothetical protein
MGFSFEESVVNMLIIGGAVKLVFFALALRWRTLLWMLVGIATLMGVHKGGTGEAEH